MKASIKEFLKRKTKNTPFYSIFRFLWHIPGKCTEPIINIMIGLRNYFFRTSIFCFDTELPSASLFPQKIIDKTIELFNPKSILDLGCGTGKSLDYFISKGINVFGVEGSALAIRRAKNPGLILKHNLNKELDLDRKFDLIWSFEFVEHIHPEYVDNLLKTFLNHSDNVVMSAAKPNQGGDGHFNEQPKSYWIKKFEKYGYRLDKDKTEVLCSIEEQYAENMLVFTR